MSFSNLFQKLFNWSKTIFYSVRWYIKIMFVPCLVDCSFHLIILGKISGHFPMRYMLTKFRTLFLCLTPTFMILNDVCRKSVRVLISRCITYFNNLFCIAWSLVISLGGLPIYFEAIFYLGIYKCMIQLSNCILGLFMFQLFKYTRYFNTHIQHGHSMLICHQ